VADANTLEERIVLDLGVVEGSLLRLDTPLRLLVRPGGRIFFFACRLGRLLDRENGRFRLFFLFRTFPFRGGEIFPALFLLGLLVRLERCRREFDPSENRGGRLAAGDLLELFQRRFGRCGRRRVSFLLLGRSFAFIILGC